MVNHLLNKTEQPAQGIWVRQTPAFHTQPPLQNRLTIDQTADLTIKRQENNASEYVVCCSRLLQMIA